MATSPIKFVLQLRGSSVGLLSWCVGGSKERNNTSLLPPAYNGVVKKCERKTWAIAFKLALRLSGFECEAACNPSLPHLLHAFVHKEVLVECCGKMFGLTEKMFLQNEIKKYWSVHRISRTPSNKLRK